MSIQSNTIRVFDYGTPGQIVTTAPVNPYTALAIPPYFRAMMFLSQNMASFPRSVRKLAAGSDVTTVPHPLDDLLMIEPNGYQDSFMFWQALFFHAAHYANGYGEIERDRASKRPVALHNLPPDEVTPFRVFWPDGRGWRQYYAVAGRENPLAAADVLHMSRLSYDGMAGIDPVALHENTLRENSLNAAYRRKFLERGTVIRAAIELPQGMDKDQAEMIIDKIKTEFTGPDAKREVIVLPNGGKVTNVGITPQDSQLMQQSVLNTKQISQITGVPPQFCYENAESKYVNTVEQAGQDVVRFTFRPWIEQAESQLNLKLLSRAERQQGLRINIDPDALLRGDTKSQTEIVLGMVKAGLITANEGRRMLGLPPSKDEEADKLKALGDTTVNKLIGDDAKAAAEAKN